MKEADVQRVILDWLAARRIYALRLNTGAGWRKGRPIKAHSGGAGVADILAFVRVTVGMSLGVGEISVPLWIEVKSDHRGVQSPEQINFEAKVRGEGHEYIVARRLDDVVGAVKRMQK